MTIAERIRARREALGLTQQQLADATGIDRSNVVGLEAGRRPPSLETLIKVASALGCSLDDLAGLPKKSTTRRK